MKIIVISIIPEIIESYVNYGVIKKAIDRKIIDIEVINVDIFQKILILMISHMVVAQE